MFAVLKRLFGAKQPAPRIDPAPARAPTPSAAGAPAPVGGPSAAAAVAVKAPVPAPTPAPAPMPASAKVTARDDDGMKATLLALHKAEPVTVLAVQASGRRVVVQQPGSRMPRAFTRRADSSYRLAGAPDRSFPKLVVQAAAGQPPRHVSTSGGIAGLLARANPAGAGAQGARPL